MAKGAKTGGRTKGTPNKVTKDVRAVIVDVAERLRGADGLFEWVKSDPVNERIFWSQIYPKMLPKEIRADVTSDGQALGPSVPVINLTLRKE